MRSWRSYLRAQSQNAVAVILVGKMDLQYLWVCLWWRSRGRSVQWTSWRLGMSRLRRWQVIIWTGERL